MNDLTTEPGRKLCRSLMCMVYLFDMTSVGVCTTRDWSLPGRLVQEFNVCTVHMADKVEFHESCNSFFTIFVLIEHYTLHYIVYYILYTIFSCLEMI